MDKVGAGHSDLKLCLAPIQTPKIQFLTVKKGRVSIKTGANCY